MSDENTAPNNEHMQPQLLADYADLQQKHEQLKAMNSRKDVFFSTFARDLESPLT